LLSSCGISHKKSSFFSFNISENQRVSLFVKSYLSFQSSSISVKCKLSNCFQKNFENKLFESHHVALFHINKTHIVHSNQYHILLFILKTATNANHAAIIHHSLSKILEKSIFFNVFNQSAQRVASLFSFDKFIVSYLSSHFSITS
jgi:hypothetical protein